MQDKQAKSTQAELDLLQDRLTELEMAKQFDGADNDAEIADTQRKIDEILGEA